MGENKQKRTYGLLGCNISYSLSPVMHNAAFRHLGINADYGVFDKSLPEVRGFVNSLAESGISGINVTVPYKVTVKDIILDLPGTKVEDFALKLGAVNTVKCTEGCIEAFNTDGPGFAESLKDDLNFTSKKLAGQKVLLLGAGGAARAVSFYLLGSEFKPEVIFVFDTDKEKARSLSSELAAIYGASSVKNITEIEAPSLVAECVLVVNATPLGTKEGDRMPISVRQVPSGTSLYDLVYARETELVKHWRKQGAMATGGLGMLVNQAVLAFNIWTGNKYSISEIKSVMRDSLPAEMRGRYGWNIS